jgi:hypothetical protein
MKKLLFVHIALIAFCTSSNAQNATLNDSVIYIDNTPVAYYVKDLNETDLHYDVYIISLDKKMLLAAKVVKFEAPVKQLKSFYYYNIIMHSTKDTFAIYHKGQAFTQELAELIQKYNLIQNNSINEKNWYNFKYSYGGNAVLKLKIREYENFLNERNFFNEQVLRDRSKPVTIVDDKIIMQDNKKIGLIVPPKSSQSKGDFISVSATPVTTASNQTAYTVSIRESGNASTEAAKRIGYTAPFTIQLLSDRIVDPSDDYIVSPSGKRAHSDPPGLYQISLPLNKSLQNEDMLWIICQYIENYLL